MSDFIKVGNIYYNLNNVTEIVWDENGDLVIFYSGDVSTRLSGEEASEMREVLDFRVKDNIIKRMSA